MLGKASEIVPRKEVNWFSIEMEKELRNNDHKGGWKRITEQFALAKLREEFDEVITAVKERKHPDEIIGECADLANIAMMIADIINNSRTSYKEGKSS